MASNSRPTKIRGRSVALVFVGAMVGVAAREGLKLAIPNRDGIPIVVPVVNILSAFVFGYLFEALARKAPGTENTSLWMQLIGVGFCGGLSTYSYLATETAVLLYDSRVGIGVSYAIGTIILGAVATFAGFMLASRLRARSTGDTEVET
ncbi:CrcB family protein [Mumia sp. zg.B53]|uniref:fluoride efflux transporter FluC n=1 Tax=Mumia sp. zg.B53 TaxID=2855449 RepID=UPI001C6E31E7|nr:CrcB family protein [Mumia sp. zg.B53]MBW9214222.1 CrcB family protein [Mumia sp. zg.B53]